MTPDPAGFRQRILARLRGEVAPEPGLSKQKAAKRERNTVRNAQRQKAITPWEFKRTVKALDGRCCYCGVEFTAENPATRDHLVPVKMGGTLERHNVVPACNPCNRSKKNKDAFEWMAQRWPGIAEEKLVHIRLTLEQLWPKW